MLSRVAQLGLKGPAAVPDSDRAVNPRRIKTLRYNFYFLRNFRLSLLSRDGAQERRERVIREE